MQFEWGAAKAHVNLRKHGVGFKEAVTAFQDPLSITVYDPDHSEEEERFITFGVSSAGRLIMVAHTDREDRIRVISARELTPSEREQYEEEIQGRKH
ncbi:MAG: BrnT family toxin [Pseudomonadota bacterium]